MKRTIYRASRRRELGGLGWSTRPRIQTSIGSWRNDRTYRYPCISRNPRTPEEAPIFANCGNEIKKVCSENAEGIRWKTVSCFVSGMELGNPRVGGFLRLPARQGQSEALAVRRRLRTLQRTYPDVVKQSIPKLIRLSRSLAAAYGNCYSVSTRSARMLSSRRSSASPNSHTLFCSSRREDAFECLV